MSFSTAAEIEAAFNEEAGDASSLAGNSEILRWWNEGQARLGRYLFSQTTLNWGAAAFTVALPADFVALDRLDYAAASARQSFRVFGRQLVIDDAVGTAASGSATLWYRAERPEVSAAAASLGTAQENYACLYYALHRFFRKLASSRVHFNRYSTLLGANGVSVSDIQTESDRLLQDYIDARADLPPESPSTFYVAQG